MTSSPLNHPDAVVAHWRASAEGDNPAGPLFSDSYAEFDLTTRQVAVTVWPQCTRQSV